jgi:PAS domain-containing protein
LVRTGHHSLTSKQRSANTLDQLEPGAQGMLRGHTLAKTIGQWGLVVVTGAAGVATGAAGFTLLGLDGIFRVPHNVPVAAVGAALSVLLVLAAMASGALITLAQGRFRNRLARIALNNMTQGLCMFDGAARLVLCNMPYIKMHHLRREQLRGGMPLRELLNLRIQTGTFSGDPDRYIADCLEQVAEGRTETRTIKFKDGRVIALVARPLPSGGWVTTHSDVTEKLAAEEERDSLRRRDGSHEARGQEFAYDFRPHGGARRGRGTPIQRGGGER